MRLMRIPTLLALLGALLYALCGCGGGASGGASTGSSSAVKLFATDDISTKYSHVWVTVLKVDLTNTAGTVNAYTSTTGQQIDVAALHGSGVSSVFAFLATASVPSGTYTSATLTLSPTITLVPIGSTTSVTKTFSNLDTAGDKELTVNFSPNKIVSNGSSLVFDFNLAKWTDDGSTVTGVCDDGPTTGLDNPSNQKPSGSIGTISGLTGSSPTQTFTVSRDDHCTLSVSTTSATTITNSDGSANPVLANGETVNIQGTFSTTTNSLVATSIQIQVGSTTTLTTDALAAGSLGTYTSGTTFTLTLAQARHFTPSGTTVTVATSSTSKLFGFRGESLTSAAFFALLPSATAIEVEGSYDSGSNTITADVIALQGTQSSDPNGVQVRGTATSGSSATSLTVAITQEDGLSLTLGTSITILPGTSVTYYDTTGATVDAATFTTDLASAGSVSAVGSYNAASATLTATKIRLWSASSGWNHIQFVGKTTAFASDGSFDLVLSDWQDGPFSNGLALHVTVTSVTTYTLGSGASTQSAFDAAETNASILVTGTIGSDGVFTATSVAVAPPGHHF